MKKQLDEIKEKIIDIRRETFIEGFSKKFYLIIRIYDF